MQGGLDNVVSMFLYIAKECFGLAAADVQVGTRGVFAAVVASACLCPYPAWTSPVVQPIPISPASLPSSAARRGD